MEHIMNIAISIDDHKDEIIEQTAKLVAEKLSRRKAFKEKVGDA